MADVTNVSLEIGDRPDDEGRWVLTVEYDVAFEAWERGAWFREEVAIVGVTDDGVRELAVLAGPTFQAAQVLGGDGAASTRRRTPTVRLDGHVLDVAPDGAAVWESDTVAVAIDIRRPDPVFASVDVIPLVPTAGHGDSRVQRRQFGGVRA